MSLYNTSTNCNFLINNSFGVFCRPRLFIIVQPNLCIYRNFSYNIYIGIKINLSYQNSIISLLFFNLIIFFKIFNFKNKFKLLKSNKLSHFKYLSKFRHSRTFTCIFLIHFLVYFYKFIHNPFLGFNKNFNSSLFLLKF